MVVLCGILGGIVGFVVGAVFVEVLFPNSQSWPDVVPFAVAVLGALAGAEGGRRVVGRRARPS